MANVNKKPVIYRFKTILINYDSTKIGKKYRIHLRFTFFYDFFAKNFGFSAD